MTKNYNCETQHKPIVSKEVLAFMKCIMLEVVKDNDKCNCDNDKCRV